MAENLDAGRVQQFLNRVDYPISKRTLIESARSRGADPDLLALLERLPDDIYADHLALHADLERVQQTSR